VPLETFMTALADVQAKGLTRQIGISNFNIELTKQAIAAVGKDAIATNQIELSPYLQSRKLVEYLRSMTLPNRIVMQPMTRWRASQPGDEANDLMAAYYAQRAGAGLIVSEGTYISPLGKGYAWTPGIHTPAQVAGLRKVTHAVHAAVQPHLRAALARWTAEPHEPARRPAARVVVADPGRGRERVHCRRRRQHTRIRAGVRAVRDCRRRSARHLLSSVAKWTRYDHRRFALVHSQPGYREDQKNVLNYG
jgi:hypothetical protein